MAETNEYGIGWDRIGESAAAMGARQAVAVSRARHVALGREGAGKRVRAASRRAHFVTCLQCASVDATDAACLKGPGEKVARQLTTTMASLGPLLRRQTPAA